MRFTRCFSSLGCAEATLPEVLALARRFGIAAVELRALAGTVDLPALWQASGATPETLAADVRAAGVRVPMLDTSMKLIGASAVDRAKLLAFVPWAEALGTPHLRIFDGGSTLDDTELAAAEETLVWWHHERARHGWRVDLAIETHDSLFTAAAITRTMARTGPFAVLWDAHHTWKRGGEAPAVTWAGIQRHVVHVHTKDSVSAPSARHPFTYVLPGDGEFPQTALLATLREGGYTGALSLEWERLWHPYLPPLEQALAAAAARAWW